MNSNHFASSSETRNSNRTNAVNNVGVHGESSRFAHDDGHYDHADLGADVTPERVTRGWNYSQMADCAYQVKQLPEGARAVLVFLVKAADSNVFSPKYRSVSRSVAWLQNKTLQSERTVRRHLRRIERSGILTLKTIGNNRDGNCANVWLLNPEQLALLSKEARDAWTKRKTPYDLAMESLRADVLATEEQSQAILAEHGMTCAPRMSAADVPPKSTRRRQTKTTNARLGLHHAVADHREQHGVGNWSGDDHNDDYFGDPCADTSDPLAGQVDPPVAPIGPLSNVLLPFEIPVVTPNEHDDLFHLSEDQRAPAHVRTLDKYPNNAEDENSGYIEEETANVAVDDAAFDEYLAELAAQDSADAATTQADHVAASANSTDPEQHTEGVVELGSNDNATATNTPHITAAEQITTTPTETAKAATNAVATQEITTKRKQKNQSSTKHAQPTPSCAAPSHEHDAAVLGQRAPKNATQARQWSASLYRLATAYHDPVAATVALHIASAWDSFGQVLEHSQDPAKTMESLTSAQGPLELRFAVSVGEVIERVSQAWREAEAEHHGDEYPAMDTLEFAVKNWFVMRGGESFGTPIPRGELHGRLARYVGAVYRAEATGDSSYLPEPAREKWLRRWQVRHRLTGSSFEKSMYHCDEEPEGWLLGWASANCIETATALDLWTQFRREHIDMMAQGWRMMFVGWWKARCVS